MDVVDAPYMPAKQRRAKSTFQRELDAKMRERKAKGLTHDITSEESEGLDDGGLDSDEENDLRMQFRSTQRTDRPHSAKRRTHGQPLGETIRSGDSNKWLKSSKTTGRESVKDSSLQDKSSRFLKTQSPSEIESRFGSNYGKSRSSPLDEGIYGKSRKSPVDEGIYGKSRKSPVDEGIYGKSRKSPVDEDIYGKRRTSPAPSSTSSLPRGLPGDKRSPSADRKSPAADRKSPLTKEPSKEDLIFGRKTPTNEQQLRKTAEKDWKAPSFRRSSPVLEDRPPSPAAAPRGRRTPDPTLQPISEGPTPIPRQRGARTGSPNDPRLRSKDSSPRSVSIEESPRITPRAPPKVDIFGRRERAVEEEEVEQRKSRVTSARDRRKLADTDKKIPPANLRGSGRQFGRQTPTDKGRQTPTEKGRQTPTDKGRQTPPGRKPSTRDTTSAGRRTQFDLRGKEQEDKRETTKREPSLFDFLGGDAQPDSPKPKVRSRSEHGSERMERRSALKKSVSHDSITDELAGVSGEQPSMYEQSTVDMQPRKLDPDQSSVCLELDREPLSAGDATKEGQKEKISGKQRSDRRAADDAIALVTDAQTSKFQTVSKDRTLSARSKSDVHKPQPRHSLPGSMSTEASDDTFNSTMTIRQAIYDTWTKQKMAELKVKKVADDKKKAEEDKKKDKDAKDKALDSKASYNCWMEQKKETYVKDKIRTKREDEKKIKAEKREKEEKQREATKIFKMWKEQDDRHIHKHLVEKHHRKQQKERKEDQEKAAKEKLNRTAVDGWKRKKEVKLEENQHRQEQQKQRAKQLTKQQQRSKELEATREYNEWVKKKEEQQTKEAQIKKITKIKEEMGQLDDYKPAWSPASKIIPCGR